MRIITLCFLMVILPTIPSCCKPGDDACYKAWHGLVPDANKASGYRGLTIGEVFFGEKNIKNSKKDLTKD